MNAHVTGYQPKPPKDDRKSIPPTGALYPYEKRMLAQILTNPIDKEQLIEKEIERRRKLKKYLEQREIDINVFLSLIGEMLFEEKKKEIDKLSEVDLNSTKEADIYEIQRSEEHY